MVVYTTKVLRCDSILIFSKCSSQN